MDCCPCSIMLGVTSNNFKFSVHTQETRHIVGTVDEYTDTVANSLTKPRVPILAESSEAPLSMACCMIILFRSPLSLVSPREAVQTRHHARQCLRLFPAVVLHTSTRLAPRRIRLEKSMLLCYGR